MTNNTLQQVLAESGIDPEFGQKHGVYMSESGVCFPYFNLDGDQIGERIKLEPPEQYSDVNGKLIKKRYHQEKDSSLHCFFSKDHLAAILNPEIPLVITEGEKKCLKYAQDLPGFPVVSYPGVWNWVKKNRKGKFFCLKSKVHKNARLKTALVLRFLRQQSVRELAIESIISS